MLRLREKKFLALLDSKHIITNRNMISGLEDLTLRIGKYTKIHHLERNGMLLFVLMNSEYSRVHLALDQFVDIVEALQHHKFHPGVTGNLTYD